MLELKLYGLQMFLWTTLKHRKKLNIITVLDYLQKEIKLERIRDNLFASWNLWDCSIWAPSCFSYTLWAWHLWLYSGILQLYTLYRYCTVIHIKSWVLNRYYCAFIHVLYIVQLYTGIVKLYRVFTELRHKVNTFFW